MARLYRPSIPLSIQCQVAEVQLARCLTTFNSLAVPEKPLWMRKQILLTMLAKQIGCRVDELELHHRPALVNRPWDARKKDYVPPANDPEHLIYLNATDHDIETRVRGVGAQRSDLSQRRYLKRVERNRSGKIKRAWPKRAFASSRRKQ